MPAPFSAAFAGSRFADEHGRIIEVSVRRIADLKVTSGKLFACDPLTTGYDQPHGAALDRDAPVGVHPVEVAVAAFEAGDHRVACARVRFAPADRQAVRWEAAHPSGQPELPLDETWGYGVDSGTGCFFDGDAVGVVDEETSERWLEELQKTYVHTWSWFVTDVGKANVVMFSSGWGDGIYTSYWGLDANGDVVELVTDFEVLVPAERDSIELPLPLSRGAVRHTSLDHHGVTMRVPWLSRNTVILGGHGAATVALTDGTPVEMTRKGDERHCTWRKPSDGAKLSVTLTTGATLLDALSTE
jgi:hypothetical protein